VRDSPATVIIFEVCMLDRAVQNQERAILAKAAGTPSAEAYQAELAAKSAAKAVARQDAPSPWVSCTAPSPNVASSSSSPAAKNPYGKPEMYLPRWALDPVRVSSFTTRLRGLHHLTKAPTPSPPHLHPCPYSPTFLSAFTLPIARV